jgi:hypothetical protein
MVMEQAPAWLPYRLRQWIDQSRIERAASDLDRTAPTPAAPPDDADAELHMLLCRRDLRIGGVALKSLLRFTSLKLAVTLTDDGSLSAADRAWIDRHVPGGRWLGWPCPDPALAAAMKDRPQLHQLYHSPYAPVCKLMHSIALARVGRVIVLDPDTAFFREPTRFVQWVQQDERVALYLHDHQDETTQVPAGVNEAFDRLQRELTPPDRSWSLQHRFFNSGLLVFRPDELDLDHAERYLAWWRQQDESLKQGKAAIWFGHWTPEQTCFHILFAWAAGGSEPLGDAYHLGGKGGHTFNHFLRHYLVKGTTHRMLRELIATMPRA